MRAGRVAAVSPSQRLRALYREHHASPPFHPIMPHDRRSGPPPFPLSYSRRDETLLTLAPYCTTYITPTPQSFSHPLPPTDLSPPFTSTPDHRPVSQAKLCSEARIGLVHVEIEIADWRLELDRSSDLNLGPIFVPIGRIPISNLRSSISIAHSLTSVLQYMR